MFPATKSNDPHGDDGDDGDDDDDEGDDDDDDDDNDDDDDDDHYDKDLHGWDEFTSSEAKEPFSTVETLSQGGGQADHADNYLHFDVFGQIFFSVHSVNFDEDNHLVERPEMPRLRI